MGYISLKQTMQNKCWTNTWKSRDENTDD
jgi:hypothetical protein